MIEQHLFPVEPWRIRETRFDMGLIAQSESLFTVSNGHIGLRGNLDEGDPHGVPGTYLNSFYELRALPYAEAGYGYPESGQTLVNVTNGKLIRLLVDDEPLDIRYGTLESHERVLDLRAGALIRTMEWVSPAGKRIRLRSTRHGVVHPARHRRDRVRGRGGRQRRPADPPVGAGGERGAAQARRRPARRGGAEEPAGRRRSAASPSAARRCCTRPGRATCSSPPAWSTSSTGPGRVEVETDARKDWARTTVVANLKAGEKLRVVKLLAYGWSSQRTEPALRDQVAAALTGARYSGFEGPDGGAAQVPRRLLGRRRRRGRGRLRDPAGGAVRAVPRAAGRRAGRAALHRRQGAHRPRLRRPHLLGHRGLRAAGAHPHAAGGRRRRAALAALDAGPRQGAGRDAQPGRRRVPVAHDPRPGVLRLLAGRHRGVPHQRRHRHRRAALRRQHRRHRRSRRRPGSSCSSRRRGCGCRSVTTTRPARGTSSA